MEYRKLGKSNIEVSVIGFGCEGFLNKSLEYTKEMFDFARSYGVNCMDLYSPDPDLHKRVGQVIKEYRNEFILQGHICTKWADGQYSATRNLNEVINSFETQLRNLDTDYLDIGMIHYVDSLETWQQVIDNGILDYAKSLKEQGKIKLIGLSSHNPIVALEVIKHGIEVLMFSVNPCYDLLPGDDDCEALFDASSYEKEFLNFDPLRVQLYEACQREGVAITVMKAFGGGELLSENSPAKLPLTPTECIHYALTRPAVVTVFSGVRSKDDLEKSLYYCNSSDSEKDYAKVLAKLPKISWEGSCMYCGHCAPCARKIDIASVTKFLNLCIAQNEVPETVREHYKALKYHASDCIECGACEKRCPFSVKIIENMKKAKDIFGY